MSNTLPLRRLIDLGEGSAPSPSAPLDPLLTMLAAEACACGGAPPRQVRLPGTGHIAIAWAEPRGPDQAQVHLEAPRPDTQAHQRLAAEAIDLLPYILLLRGDGDFNERAHEASARFGEWSHGTCRLFLEEPLTHALLQVCGDNHTVPTDWPHSRALQDGRPRVAAAPGQPDQPALLIPFEHAGVRALLSLYGLPTLEPRHIEAARQLVALAAQERAADLEHARLQRDRRALHTLLEEVQCGVLAGTSQSDVMIYNPALQRMLGWTVADIEARGWAPLVYPDPEYRAQMRRAIAAHFQGHQSINQEVVLTGKDGRRHECQINTGTWPDEHGAPVVHACYQEHTQLRQVQRQLRRCENMQALSQHTGSIAHDFRNTLTTVLGQAELIELKCAGQPDIARKARAIAASATRSAELVNQLLAYGGAHTSKPHSIDLAQLLQDHLEAQGIDTDARIIIESEPDLPAALMDTTSLQRALDNVLRNARDAVAPLGGAIHVQLGRAPHPKDGHPMVRVRVHDEGPGFSAEARAHLFEPFFTTRPEGHGLGLAATRNMLHTLGGCLDAPLSEQGAIVDLYLPLAAPPTAEDTQAQAGHEHIWVIEQVPIIARVFHKGLTQGGYGVRMFPSVEAMTEALATQTPDLCIAPQQQTQALLQVLRGRALRTPVILTSQDDLPPPTNPQRTCVLRRPFTIQELLQCTRDLLDRAVLVPGTGKIDPT